MKYFTKAQIEEIRKQLATLGIRDTDLPTAHELEGDEIVAIVQNGENRKVGVRTLIHDYLPEDIADGKDGESAYEIWRNQPGNYNKSVQEFLDSLKGADGRNGTNGTNGTNGVNGTSAGFGTPHVTLETDDSGVPSAQVSASGPNTAKVFDFTFKNIAGGGSATDTWRGVNVNGSSFKGTGTDTGAINIKAGSNITLSTSGNDLTIAATGGGGGGEGGGGESGGRSITGVDMWFKLSASTSEEAPNLTIADPSSYAGGRWSLSYDHPTAELPYLWAFMQINYDQVGPNGYAYSRSDAYIARNYNASSSEEFSSLESMIESLRSEMATDMAGYEADLLAINASLNTLRTSIEGSITSDINAMKARFAQIDTTDVKKIENNAEGVWGVMTSYVDDTNGQKSFSDIMLNAKEAKNTLSVGSQFFGNRTSAEVNLDGIKGEIALKATRDYVDSSIASAQFSVDPGALKSVISKGQKVWMDGNNILYPYDHHLGDGTFTPDPQSSDGELVQYEDYMVKTAAQGGPSDGPFTLASVVTQFSTIQQTVDGFTASVNNYKYMWELSGAIYGYDYFETQYENRASQYSGYTYENYVTNILRATKVEVGNVLSNFAQSSNEIRSTLGDMGYIWRKQNQDGTYQYQRYAVPSNKTRNTYVSEMTTAGWDLYDYSTKMTVIDQTLDSITLAVKKSEVVWIKPSLAATNAEYSVPYDYWYDDYLSYKSSHSSYTGTYEQYVSSNHSGYELKNIAKAFSEIKQEAGRISSAVEDISDLSTTVSGIQQTAEEIALTAGKTYKAWKNSQEDIQPYSSFESEWEISGSSLGYEQWVQTVKNYSLFEVSSELAGLKVRSDKIWAGVKNSNGTDVAASISILAGADTAGGGSKIVLDSDIVQVEGTLSAGIVNAAFANIANINATTKDNMGLIVADSGIFTNLTAGKLLTTGGNGTLNILAQNGLLGIYLGAINESNLAQNRRAAFGIESGNVVLKFYDENGNELYNLGPAGIRNNGAVSIPIWSRKQLYYSSSAFTVGTNLKPLTASDYYKYEDGYMILSVAGSQYGAISYMDPYNTSQYIGSNHSSIHGVYFDEFPNKVTSSWVSAHSAPNGYYISHQIYWNTECDGYDTEEDSSSASGYSDYFTGMTAFRVQNGNITQYNCTVKVFVDRTTQTEKWVITSFQ